jgi:hypothetical protein
LNNWLNSPLKSTDVEFAADHWAVELGGLNRVSAENPRTRFRRANVLHLALLKFEVGWQSVRQFGRDRSRLFGQPPMREFGTLPDAITSTRALDLKLNLREVEEQNDSPIGLTFLSPGPESDRVRARTPEMIVLIPAWQNLLHSR